MTTSAFWLVEHFNRSDGFQAAWVDLETAREEPDSTKAFRTILAECDAALARQCPELTRPSMEDIERMLVDPARALRAYFVAVCAAAPRPLVIFFDEADGLVGRTVVSFLTQLRAGYMDRDRVPFLSSAVLIGMRPVRDYVMAEEERQALAWLGTTSPFNITAEATTLAAFRDEEVSELLEQHTAETGQRFLPEAIERVCELGRGQPWLTNALADQAVRRAVPDRSMPITRAHIDAAKETIISERRTHIDSLVARLREPRIRRILDPMLAGLRPEGDPLDDDLAYAVSLGLITLDSGYAEIANPIYREVIPRALTYAQQVTIAADTAWYVRPDGRLHLDELLAAWQTFWQEDGHLAAAGFSYQESGPHLMLMAFLQRVVNGQGQIIREYALGRGAMDLVIIWRGVKHVIEVKLRRDTYTESRALQQLQRYLVQVGVREGYLVLFDLRKTRSWDEKLFRRTVTQDQRVMHIVGC